MNRVQKMMLSLVMLWAGQLVYAQRADLIVQGLKDSLQHTPAHLVEKRADLLFKLGSINFDSISYDTALFYFKRLAKIPNVENQISPALWVSLCDILGMTYAYKLNTDEAIRWLEKGIKTVQQHQVPPKVKCDIYGHLMEVYFPLGDHQKTNRAAQTYIQTAYQCKDTFHIINANLNLAFFFRAKEDKVNAEKHLKKVRQLTEQSQNKKSMWALCIYESELALVENDLIKARAKVEEAYELSIKYDRSRLVFTQLRLAEISLMENKLAQAFEILSQCKPLLEKRGDSRILTYSLSIYIDCLRAQGNQRAALQVLLQELNRNGVDFRRWAVDQLPALYASLGRYKEAYQALDSLFLAQEDELNSASEVTKQMELKQQAEQNKLQQAKQQLKLQTAQNIARRSVLGVLVAVMLSALIYILLRNRLLTEKNRSLQLKAEAQKKAEELRAFNYSLGHDLKTPIDNAKYFLQRFKQKFGEIDQESTDYLHQMEVILEDTRNMIGGMLAYAEQEQIPFLESEIDTHQEVEKLAKNIQSIEIERQIEFQLGELPVINGDKLMLRQVLSNLISNAVKFSRFAPKTQIKVYAEQREGFWDVFVKDNGTGIPENTQSRLFQLFKTAHDRSVYPGTGVGLSIVKRVIERHQGNVWAYNNPEGGATFGFSIPHRRD